MKIKYFLLLLLMYGNSFDLFADGGTCVKFEVEITLQNDSIIRGCYYTPYYDLPVDSQTVYRVIDNKISPYYFDFKDSIEIYKTTINLLDSDIYGSLISSYSADRCRISFDDIKEVRQIRRLGCGHVSNNDWEFSGNGLYPFVITEFSDHEIDKISSTTPNLFFYFDKCDCWGLSVIYVISFNHDLTKEAIADMLEKRICQPDRWKPNSLDRDKCRLEYNALKNEFKSKDIIIFKVHYEN